MIFVPYVPVPEGMTAGDIWYVIWPEVVGTILMFAGLVCADHDIGGPYFWYVPAAVGLVLIVVFLVRPLLPGFGFSRAARKAGVPVRALSIPERRAELSRQFKALRQAWERGEMDEEAVMAELAEMGRKANLLNAEQLSVRWEMGGGFPEE